MRHQYKNPPVQEALCEFRFDDEFAWDPRLPGRVSQQLADDYDGPAKDVVHVEANIELPGPDTGVEPTVRSSRRTPRARLFSKDEDRLLTLGADLLAVHTLEPYDGWEAFKPRIRRALETYTELTGSRSISRIGVRYINRIEYEEASIELPDHFTISPREPPRMPKSLAFNGFQLRTEHRSESGELVVTQFANAPPGDNAAIRLILDIDASLPIDHSLDPGSSSKIDDAMDLVERLRDLEREVFEAYITDALRGRFNGLST